MVLVGLALAATIFGPTIGGVAPAGAADPAPDALAQTVSQIETTNQYITSVGQEYDAAVLKLQAADQLAARDHDQVVAFRKDIVGLKTTIAARAAANYRAGVAGRALDALQLHTTEALSVREHYAAVQAARDNADLRQMTADEATITATEHQAEQAKADAEAARAALATTKQQLEAANQQRILTVTQAQSQFGLSLADQQRRRAATELALALGEFNTTGGGDPGLFPGVPAVSPQAAIAIAYARAQIGKPYLYAAAGPDSFDCSGLVMAAYAYAGIRLPHYSGAQYALLPHVPLSAAQPGDLLFWGIAGSQHAAIYVGAGRVLEAGGTGNDVHVGPVWGHPVGAARVL